MKFFLRSIFIFLGILVLTGFVANYVLTYKAKELLQGIVSKVTKDSYKLEAKKITFYYRNAGISGEHIKLIPIGNQDKKATISLDKVEIRLESFWHLLRNRKLEVKTIEFIKPDLIAYAKKKSGSAKRGIAETINEIQLKLFEVIDVLRVKKVSISDAALKIYSADNAAGSYFSVNHLNLNLHDIQVLPSVNASTPQINLNGNLTLNKPDIHLANQNIALKLGKLDANLSTISLAIDELNLSIFRIENKTQNIVLSSFDVNHFNWNRFLKEGIIELDTVLVNQGLANINITKKKFKHNQTALTKSKGYLGTSIVIHHTFISNIAYHLNKQQTLNGEEDKIMLNLKGDSMYLKEFSLTNGRQPAFDVDELQVALKNVEERDSKAKLHFSLDAIAINQKSLILKNYLLETNAADKNKNYLRVAIPEFQLNNYSLEEVLQKNLAASNIYLKNPDITFDIREKKNKDKTHKKNLDDVFGNLMESVSKKVKLEEIQIENGNFTFLPTLSPEDKININRLSVVLDAAKFPRVTDFHDFIHAIKHLDSKEFTVKGKNMELAVTDMELQQVPRGVHFGSIKGHLGNGKLIDLKGVTVLINDSISNYRRKSDFHASAIFVESGVISLDLIKKEVDNKPAGNTPSFLVDTLNLKNVVFNMRKGETIGASEALNIVARNLIFQDKDLSWTTLGVDVASLNASVGGSDFKAGNLNFINPGMLQIRNVSGSKSNPNASIDFSTPELKITLGLTSANSPRLIIDEVSLMKPFFKIAINQHNKLTEASIKDGKAITKDIALKKLLLTEPSVDFTLTNKDGKKIQQHKVFTGSFLMENIHSFNQPEVYVGKLLYKTTNPQSEIKALQIHPSALELSLSEIKYNTINKHFSLHVDTALVENVVHTIYGKKQDTLYLEASTIGLGNFNYAKGDSLSLDKLLYSTNWSVKNANLSFNNPQQRISAWSINIAGKKSVNLSLDSFAIINQLSKEAVWQSTPYEKGYQTITGGKVSLLDMKLQMVEKKPSVLVEKMLSQNLQFTVSKDKTKLEDTITYKPLLGRMLTSIPLKLKIDSLLFQNARVDAHEISKKTGKETHIFFTEMNGYLKNVKTWDVMLNDTLDMRVRTRFYGTDQLRLHFKQSYDDTLQGFWMRARMSHFNMPEMNKLLTPLQGLKLDRGIIDSLLLVANGNDYFAYGTMDLRFHDLRAKLLKTEETKGKFLVSIENFFVGLLLRKHDNGRTDILFKERLRKRAIFNFWAKISLEGLLSNLGIKSDKKERKQFEKTIEKFNLPEKYWDEIDDF